MVPFFTEVTMSIWLYMSQDEDRSDNQKAFIANLILLLSFKDVARCIVHVSSAIRMEELSCLGSLAPLLQSIVVCISNLKQV